MIARAFLRFTKRAPVIGTDTDLAAAGGLLTIDLDAVAANYDMLRAEAAGAEVSAVVKANAYGLGMGPVARRLAAEGCRSFFVAEANEGAALRALLPDAEIYVLNGLFPGTAGFYAAHGLVPCLASMAEVAEWREAAKGGSLKAALHFDTGMNRLGMSEADAAALAAEGALTAGIEVRLIMSHLACADDAASPMNARQLARFRGLRTILAGRFAGAKASLANSGGIYLGKDYHFDLVRPGVSLYGGSPFTGREHPFRPAVTVEARVLAVREMAAEETAGYGATWKARGTARMAVLAAGYADGYMRALSSPRPNGDGGDDYGGQVRIAGYTAPVAGRISMDMLIVDVSGLPEGAVKRGDMAELIGPHITVDDVGLKAGTLGYEILTSLGGRYMRIYVSGGKAMTEGGGRV
ncbi:alanine racemase [Parvibaculum lavamentivorans DS-1]|uniref:Alanine racemase n=1 Tax=Parvibaculum lavamentivorans (strain DS-1 / DSM 13023 / NCIMB 13966) TaxID=402881 RepID=A7HYU8_PARL1|nr:alanine racemase [Parvibaculum lavamentivorans]ABS65081.1 alanine racemase [Parvibaculum lavamentivorans DS-1]